MSAEEQGQKMLDWLDAIQLRLNLSITGIHLLIDGTL
jgi:hypothetical protein